MAIEWKYWYNLVRVKDKTDAGLSTRDRKEADQGLYEVHNASKVSATVTFNAGGAIDDKSQIQWNCAN